MDSISGSLPTFYEIVMQDRLNEMFWQSIKLIVSVAFDKYSRFVGLRYYVEEVSSVICAAIDCYSLIKTKGTFTENFYSLCRDFNSKKSVFSYLFLHYFVPLISKSLAFRQVHDVLKGLFMTGFLYFNVPYFSPEFFVLKQKLVRQSGKYQMSYSFIGLLIAIKCLEIYFNSSKKESSVGNFVEIEPPYSESEVGKGVCGICKESWTNPTALTCSGYVFCYACIKTHLEIFAACPITKKRASIRNLRKIMV